MTFETSPHPLARYGRFFAAVMGSATATVATLYLMVQLVQNDDLPQVIEEPYIIVDFVRIPEEETIIVKPPKVVEPPPVEKEPPPPLMVASIDTNHHVGVEFTPPVKSKPQIGASAGISDGDPIPIVKVAPQYPATASRRGIEGYVVLSFTITTTGGISDAVVVEGNPSGIFDRAALNAVKKFKYRPRVVNGEPQAVHNVQHRLVFELVNG